MATPEDFRQIASKISLSLDNPESVKLQIKQIILAQKELRIFRKDLSATVSNISADQPGAIQSQKQKDCQPCLKLQEAIAIEHLILEGHRLKLLAVEYLLNPEAVTTQLQAEEKKKRLDQQQGEKSWQSKKFPKFWYRVVIFVGFVLLAKSYFLLSNPTSNQETAETQKLETTVPEIILGTPRPVSIGGSGNCDNPDDNDSRGKRCGGRAASVRPEGR